MFDKKSSRQKLARHIIDLSSDAIPEFIFQRTANKTLSFTVSELNKLALFGAGDEKQTAVEALTRLGFINPGANNEFS